MSRFKKLTTIAAVAALAVGLAACGGGDDDTAMEMPPPPPTPTPYEMAIDNIADAATAADAQAAYDAVKDDVTASEGEDLQDAVNARTMALATAARAAMQRMDLMDAAGGIPASVDATAEAIAAASTAIGALQDAIDAADDIDDTSMYEAMITAANMLVETAQGHVDTQGRMAMQMTALTTANTALTTALGAIAGMPTQAQIDDAETALAALNTAIADAADIDDTQMYATAAASAQAAIEQAEKTLMANMDQEEADRIAAEEEADRIAAEKAAADAAAMAVTARKLYAGISAPGGTGDAIRTAAHDADGNIEVTIGTEAAVDLSEDEDATVAERHGWTGMMFNAEPDGDAGIYEAVVYSHVGEATQGPKFSDTHAYDTAEVDGTNTELQVDTGTAEVQARIASPSFDQSAGAKTFELGENLERVILAGSYRGVAGTYYCDPTATCSATVASSGFTLGGGTWTFKATDPEQRLMDAPDDAYASYGWWLHKSEDGDTFTASAFAAYRGTVAAAENIGTLQGSATYMGGAAGKYSLRSSTGGTNDAGHFTADATLEADFGDDMITGTINNFTGADGEPRNWSVELMESGVGDTGTILGTDGTGDPMQTKWTIDGTAGAADGQWRGNLYENDTTSLVPQVATGTFYSTYGLTGSDGRMVGAFGANAQ